jgi:hypothetical protein
MVSSDCLLADCIVLEGRHCLQFLTRCPAPTDLSPLPALFVGAAALQGQAAAAVEVAAAGTHGALSAAAKQHGARASYAQPFWRQLVECTSKALGSYWKSPAYNLLRLLMTAACALVYGK